MLVWSSKVVWPQSTSLDDAFERANWNRLVSMDRDDYLPPIGVAPFLVGKR